MLSDELHRFLNEINSEKIIKVISSLVIISLVIFTVCKNGIFMNSGLTLSVPDGHFFVLCMF